MQGDPHQSLRHGDFIRSPRFDNRNQCFGHDLERTGTGGGDSEWNIGRAVHHPAPRCREFRFLGSVDQADRTQSLASRSPGADFRRAAVRHKRLTAAFNGVGFCLLFRFAAKTSFLENAAASWPRLAHGRPKPERVQPYSGISPLNHSQPNVTSMLASVIGIPDRAKSMKPERHAGSVARAPRR